MKGQNWTNPDYEPDMEATLGANKYKNDIGKIENMEYDKISDFYTCKNNRKLTVSHIRHNKTKTGHAVQKIPKQRDCECTRLKYSFSNCKKHK
jgi:hypothetical protein